MLVMYRKARAGRGHTLEPHQRPPVGDWDIWYLKGGRGSGKTEAGATVVIKHLREFGARARVGCGAPIVAAARETMAEGETGLITLFPDEFQFNRSLLEARHERGGYVKFQGSEKPERWNGPQWTFLWADELALWSQRKTSDGGTSWDHALIGLRLGENPRAVVTSTPKNRKFLRNLEKEPGVVVTRATTYDNPHLAQRTRDRLERKYGGTELGRQELLAEDIEEAEDALWQRAWIKDLRVDEAPELYRIVVALDPSGGSDEDADEQGIVVAGAGLCRCRGDRQRHGFVLRDLSGHYTPNGWARRTVAAYKHHKADRIVAEKNYGGEMVEATLRSVDPNIAYRAVHASRGKQVRAEPIAALYEPKQQRIHHVGAFPELEDELCTWVPGEGRSPNRLDALVWALTDLMPNRPVWQPPAPMRVWAA